MKRCFSTLCRVSTTDGFRMTIFMRTRGNKSINNLLGLISLSFQCTSINSQNYLNKNQHIHREIVFFLILCISEGKPSITWYILKWSPLILENYFKIVGVVKLAPAIITYTGCDNFWDLKSQEWTIHTVITDQV